MRSLYLLLVVAVALGNCDLSLRSKRSLSGWGSSLATARINSQEMRLNQLAEELDSLETAIAKGDNSIPASMQSLALRLNKIEGDDCGHREFSCGRHSGQCVFDMLVCDHVKDCANGADESEEACKNPCPAGRSWSGVADWTSCMVRSNNKMNLLITGNKRIDHFPSQLWLDAVIFESYTVAGEKIESSWSMNGMYHYASKTISLNPPTESTMGIGLECEDAGDRVAQCNFVRVSDRHVCGTVTLSRGD